MNIAVKFWSQNPDKPAAMPGEWPWACREIGGDIAYMAEPGLWTIMSVASYNDYVNSYQSAYDDYALQNESGAV